MTGRFAISVSLLVLAITLFLSEITDAQSIVPQAVPLTTCSSGEFISFGTDNVTALDVRTGSSIAAPSQYIMTSMFNSTRPGATISQISFGILDNLQITTVTLLRLALFRVSGNKMSLVVQTDEIQLYATTATVIYGNIPPTQLQIGQYALAFWSNSVINTAVNLVPSSQSSVPTVGYATYTYNGYPVSVTLSYVYGSRALRARGCLGADPMSSPDNRLFSFCAWTMFTKPATTNNWQYTGISQVYVMSGVIAQSTTDVGTSAAGAWGKLKGGFANVQAGQAGGYYYSYDVAIQAKDVLLGGDQRKSYNQLLYAASTAKVDSQGISFVTANGEQYIVTYANGAYSFQVISPGSMESVGGPGSINGFTLTPINSINEATTCNPPSSYMPDQLVCPAGSVPITVGDSDRTDAESWYGSYYTGYNYGNIIHQREFTARAPGLTLRQLTFAMNKNPLKVAKMRMGLFTHNGSMDDMPQYFLVAQTREVILDNIGDVTIAIDLERPVTLTFGQNYSIGYIADQAMLSAYSYWANFPLQYSQTYANLMRNGFPGSVNTNELVYSLPIGGTGCVAEQTLRQFSFCAGFRYRDTSVVYTGVLTALANPLTSGGRNYYLVTAGSGTATTTQSSGSFVTYNFTAHEYNLYTNNRLYVDGPALDQFGLQLVVNPGPGMGYAVQIATFFDPASASYEFKENLQQFYTTSVEFRSNWISSFSYAAYSGALPSCAAPERPGNVISPPPAPRVVCPNRNRTIVDTYGDASVASFAVNADGTQISANKIYTYPFTAEASALVYQIALGILRNTDRPGTILVRMGIYSAATNLLLGQTPELSLTQALDQVIPVNLASPVSLAAGERYYIALIANAPLEVATSATATNPSMQSTWNTAGLPSTFATDGNAVAVSIAAFVCVSTTHSFCGYYQYYVPTTGSTVSLLYQGLIQAVGSSQQNGYGTYLPITAAAGRLTSYVRTSGTPTQTTQVYTFQQKLGTTANLYTTSANNMALDTAGLQVQVSNDVTSQLCYNSSINKVDESWRGIDKEQDLLYSGFNVVELNAGTGIPSCGLPILPHSEPDRPALPTCPAGEEQIWYGDADNYDVQYNTDGYYYAPAGQIFLRPVTTHTTKGTILSQVKFAPNTNWNTVNRVRLGLYNSNFTFMAGTPEMRMINPYNQMFTGILSSPQYLAPNTKYYLAMWTEHAIYSGFTSGDAPAMVVPFNQNWPQAFVNDVPNSQRAVGAVGCTTAARTDSDNGGGGNGNPQSSSSSSSGLSDGGVAGVVIGCVIFSNLLILGLMYLCCLAGSTTKRTTEYTPESSQSRAE